ncbi:hypothetical protein, variant [Fonticula alba]|uniref:ATP-dependent Clp protease ATP-binding subunit ClpX n=1 Tax=Fonticula alba TaxID=691883 RepID=A0A058Z620_FONAL|nr:hypothetical protein, variant [Fonticula alba]KCV69378.1 hypothetical protein, variant [Fonticula alba]|eukprot:XP_009495943.1 hypothetical protein, variant [Fonticula alba]
MVAPVGTLSRPPTRPLLLQGIQGIRGESTPRGAASFTIRHYSSSFHSSLGSFASREFLSADEQLLRKMVLKNPRELHTVLDEFVIGQEKAKRVLSVAVYNHYTRVRRSIGMAASNRRADRLDPLADLTRPGAGAETHAESRPGRRATSSQSFVYSAKGPADAGLTAPGTESSDKAPAASAGGPSPNPPIGGLEFQSTLASLASAGQATLMGALARSKLGLKTADRDARPATGNDDPSAESGTSGEMATSTPANVTPASSTQAPSSDASRLRGSPGRASGPQQHPHSTDEEAGGARPFDGPGFIHPRHGRLSMRDSIFDYTGSASTFSVSDVWDRSRAGLPHVGPGEWNRPPASRRPEVEDDAESGGGGSTQQAEHLTIGEIVPDKSNVLLLGPTGTGKTLLVKALAKHLGVPFASCDATTLTQTGYVGDDVDTVLFRLLQAANFDHRVAQYGIVFIDEVDKLRRRSTSASIRELDVGGEAVQQGLLRMLEGEKINVTDRRPPSMAPGGGKREGLTLDTRHILFVLAGAFEGIDDFVWNRLNFKKSKIGFGAPVNKDDLLRAAPAAAKSSDDQVDRSVTPAAAAAAAAAAAMAAAVGTDCDIGSGMREAVLNSQFHATTAAGAPSPGPSALSMMLASTVEVPPRRGSGAVRRDLLQELGEGARPGWRPPLWASTKADEEHLAWNRLLQEQQQQQQQQQASTGSPRASSPRSRDMPLAELLGRRQSPDWTTATQVQFTNTATPQATPRDASTPGVGSAVFAPAGTGASSAGTSTATATATTTTTSAAVAPVSLEPTPEDLIAYGLIPELVGRLPVLAQTMNLPPELLARVLSEPKGCLIEQYKAIFQASDIDLQFEEGAFLAIGRLAAERRTGARGLRAILENLLLDAMYSAPGAGVARVIVTVASVTGAEPRLAAGEKLPFDEITLCNIGNPQQLGQKPITFFRQVSALVDCPSLLAVADSQGPDGEALRLLFPADVIARAQKLAKAVGSTGSYSHSQGVPHTST